MKIAWFANSIPGTGGGRYYLELANRLMDSYGHSISFHLQDMGNAFGEQMKATIKQLPQWCDISYDVAICGDPGRGHVVGFVFDKVPIKKKFWTMNFYNGEFMPWVENSAYTKICQTTWFYHMARTVDVKKNAKLCLGGVDTKFWSYKDTTGNLGLLTYPKKSGWTAVEAIRLVIEKHPELHMLRFGGEEAGWKESDFPKGTINVGHPAHETELLRSAYHQALVFVNAESNYGWGFSQCIAEAMCCGVAVVGGDFEGFNDMLIDNVTGLTVPNARESEIHGSNWITRPSPRDLCEKILTFIENDGVRAAISKNARNNIEKFDYDIMAERFNEIICD